MSNEDVLHRIEHEGKATYVSAATVYDLEHIGLIRWHRNDLSGPKLVQVYKATNSKEN